MSYEYNVPFVDFITHFGDDDADQFFDEFENLTLKQSLEIERKPEEENEYLENLPPKKTPERERKPEEENERPVLRELLDFQITRSAESHRKVLQKLPNPRDCKTVEAQKVKCTLRAESVVKNLTAQVSRGFTKPILTAKYKKYNEAIEDVNGELCIKNEEKKHTGVPRNIPNQRTRTILHSQSFEERQKLPKKRREEIIKKVLEEEQKKRDFHANPLPNYIKLIKQKTTASDKPTKSSSHTRTTVTFHARPSYVVSKQPFVPKRIERSAIKPGNVVQHTDKRVKERKEFDEKLKLHKKEQEDAMQAIKEEQMKRDKEEIVELRKKLVHKARPAPSYKGACSSVSPCKEPKS